MTTRIPTGRAIEVPDLVGVKADQAIQQLRDLGLMPITWSAAVDGVNDAGFVLGLDPPAGSPVRPKTHITLSVATHPDFQGHADDALAAEPHRLVQPPLTWPLSGPTGFVAPASAPEDLTDAFATATAPSPPSASASPPLDVAASEIWHDDAAASSDGEPTPWAAADPYLHDVLSPVPTPDEIAADAEWDRLRAAEAARHVAGDVPSPEPAAPPAAPGPTVDADETAVKDSAQALEEQARRAARRRSARQHRRLTLKQKAIVVGVLALTVFIGFTAMSGHKPVVRPAWTAHTAPNRNTRPARRTRTRAAAHHKQAKVAVVAIYHKRAQVRKHRVVTVHKHARSHTVRVHASSPATSHTSPSSPLAPISSGPSDTVPTSTRAGSPPTTTAPAITAPAAPTPSHKPASAPSSTDSHSSGSGGGSALQSPDGTTAPPQP